MQIFKPYQNNNECAKSLDDKRLNKIIIESTQIASTALWINDCNFAEILTAKKKIYLPSHEYHPLCKWGSENYINFSKIIKYGLALCHEYNYRFNKIHKCKQYLLNMFEITHFKYYNSSSEQPNCTIHMKHIKNLYKAYQQELSLKWNKLDKRKPKWTKRLKPKWSIYYD